MKKMKRVLSCILAVLLVVSALPLSASAAVTGKIGSIGVRLVDIPNAKDVTLFARPSGRESNLLKNHPDGVVSEKEDGSASTVADFENAMKALEGVIAPTTAAGSGTETDPYQIPKGSKFYVAIDINSYRTDGAGFTTGMTPVLQFPKDAFTVNTRTIAHPAVAGLMNEAVAFEGEVGKYLPGSSGFTLVTTAYLNRQDKDGNATDRFTNQFSGGTGYLPTTGSWEALMEVTAGSTSGEYYLEIAPEKTNPNGGQVTAIPYNEGGWKDDGTYDAKNVANDGASTDNIDFGERVYIKITNPSEAPDGNYDGAIINKKNLPYMSAAAAADENARTDYLKFPSDETKFKVGDTVMFYKTTENENEYGELIGETTITADNLVVLNADGTVTAAPSLNDGDAVNTTEGLALKLVDDLKGSTEANKPVSADYSFLKNEKEIYIARREKAASEDDVKDPSYAANSPKAAVDPENNVFYYNQDTVAVPEGAPGSEENPLELKLGDSMADVVDALDAQGISLSTKINAPIESGVRSQNRAETYVTSSWRLPALYNGTAGLTQKGMNTDGVYNKHGLFTIRNPYKEKVIDGITYKQPTEYYETPSAIPEGGYASVIYVNVLPNPADYYLAVNAEGTSLAVLGDTKDFMIESDQIFLWDDETKTGTSWEALFTIDAADLTKTGITPETLKNTPAVGDIMWLSYQNTPVDGETFTQSDKIQIRVADGDTAIVLQDAEVEENFGPDEELNDLLDYVESVNFTVVGPIGADKTVESREYPLTSAQLKQWINSGTDYTSLAHTTVATLDTAGTETPSDITALNATGKTLGDRYKVSIDIPETADYNTLTSGTAVDYTNADPARAVKITAKVAKVIRIDPAAEYHVTENKPLGMDDTMVISGDTYGQLAQAIAENPKSVGIVLQDETGAPICTAYGENRDGEAEILVEVVEPDAEWNYTVKFERTARNYGTKLKICSIVIDQGGETELLKEDFELDKQEEYVLFSVDQPTPETVQIVKSDLVADPENDTYTADDVINKIADVSGVTGPKLTYGYYMSNPLSGEQAPVQDPSATWSMPLADNIYQSTNWTAGGTDFETAPVTITLNDGVVDWTALSAANKNTADTAETTLPINKPSAAWTAPAITQKVEVVAKKYDEEETPKPSDIITNSSDTVANNNPYPQNDEIRVHNGPAADGYANLVVDIYTAYDAENDKLSGHIASAKLGTDDTTVSLPAVFDSGIAPATVLNSMGGKLWYTVRKEAAAGVPGMAPSDPIAKAYNVEDYILWTGTGLPSITPETLQMRYSETGAVDFENNIKTRLPNTAKAVAVHLTQDENGKYEIRNSEQVTVYPTVKQWLTAAGDPVTDATFSDPAPDATADYQLKAQYDAASVTTPGDDPDAPKNEINVPEGLSDDKTAKIISRIDAVGTTSPEVTPAAGYDITNEVTLTLTDDTTTVAKTVKPDPAAVKIDPSTDPDHPENYTINIDISGATNKDDFDITKMDVIVKYPGPDGNYHYFLLPTPFTAVEGEEGKITPAVINKDSATVTGDDLAAKIGNDPSLAGLTFESFQGLDPTVNGTVEIYFKEEDKVKSDRQDATYEKASGALDLTDDIEVASLHINAGSLTANQDLLDLVSSYMNAETNLNGQDLVIPMVAAGTPPKVSWTLKKSTTGAPAADASEIDGNYVPEGAEEGTAPTATGWAEAMKTIPENGKFYLEAALDVEHATDGTNQISVTNSGNKVAFISISLYTSYDPEHPENQNPLQLTEGNSDVWKSLKADSTADDAAKTTAQKYLDNLNGEPDAVQRDVASFRNDLVFYYKIEGHHNAETLLEQEGNKEYVEKYTNPYLQEDGTEGTDADYSKLIESLSGTAIADVLAANENAEITITEKVVGDDGYGTQRAALVDGHIQPNTGDSLTNYYDSSAAASSVVRGVEYYQIEYKVKVGTSVYVATRNVKLGYRIGDVDLDSNINGVDAGFITAFVNRTFDAFRDENGESILSLSRMAMDIDQDTNSNGVDAGFITAFVNRTYDLPPMRF